MLREYGKKLYEAYQEKGFIPAVKSFGKSFGEYLLLETNYIKLRQIKGDNKPVCDFPYTSRIYTEIITRQPFRNVSNQNLENIIYKTKKDFLNKVR